MDSVTAEVPQILNLPDLDVPFQTIVVRHLGGDHPTEIRRVHGVTTNTYQLAGDGTAIALDWLAAQNNWYWRQAY